MERRRFVFLTGLACLSLPCAATAEILSKGSFGGREAYLKRVQDLSGLLAGMVQSDDGKRAEMRAVATTLSAAVKDMLFNEAQARSGKVAPPASALRAPAGASPATVGGEPVPLAKVPDDWLLLKGGLVQDEVSDLLALLEDEAEPLASPAITGLIGSVTATVVSINRPGS